MRVRKKRQVYGDHHEPSRCTGARQGSRGTTGHFAPVRVNETLTLDFNDATRYAILRRVREAEIAFGSDAWSREGRLHTRNGGRGVYFENLNGHILELMTQT